MHKNTEKFISYCTGTVTPLRREKLMLFSKTTLWENVWENAKVLM
jgi:hypothetical protein